MIRWTLQKGIVSLPFLMLIALVFVMQRPDWMAYDNMSLAVSIDLLAVIPFVWYLIIRKRTIPNFTVIPIMLLCLGTGLYVLPEQHTDYLRFFKLFAAPFIELGVLGTIIYKVLQLRKALRHEKKGPLDFYEALLLSTLSVFPKRVATVLATEIAVFYYAFKKPKKHILQRNEFSYHKNSGVIALYGAIVFIVLVETAVLHLLLVKWSVLFAWVLSGISLYTAVQFLAFARSLSPRPIQVNEDLIHLRFGIVSSCTIDRSNVEHILHSSSDLPEDKSVVKLGLLGPLESHNVILHLKNEVEIMGLYGLKRKAKTLALFVDDPNAFIHELRTSKD